MEENRNMNLESPNTDGFPGDDSSRILECAICLQTCIHPVRLPCRHIFCFLCVKGIANQSKRCAMCRQEIPLDYLDKPDLVADFEMEPETVFEDGFQWFYEGRNGWWQYDERTSSELEIAFKRGDSRCEVLVAGFLYVVDFHHMIQLRRNDPSRRRRIKRDIATIPKKGVAGIRLANNEDPNSEDTTDNSPATDNHNLVESTVEPPSSNHNAYIDPSSLLVSKTPSTTPATPTNTPQTPIFISGDMETSVPSSPGRSLENLDQSLTEALHTLRLHDRTESSIRGNGMQPLLDMRRQTRIQPWDIEITFSEEEEL